VVKKLLNKINYLIFIIKMVFINHLQWRFMSFNEPLANAEITPLFGPVLNENIFILHLAGACAYIRCHLI
jgi:hypothetical protein